MPFRVYVIELGDGCDDCRKRSANKGRCVYVGETWHSREDRLQQHLDGVYPAGRVVRRCGGRLRPDLSRLYPEVETREDARELEAACAAELRRQGYVVFGGH